MERTKLLVYTVCTLQAIVFMIIFKAMLGNPINIFTSISTLMQNQSNYVKITSYPVKIIGARNLVSHLRAGENSLTKLHIPINLRYKNVRFLSGPRNPCSIGEHGPVDILLIVKSAVPNRSRRMLLRSMWANETYLRRFNVTIKYAFIVGVEEFTPTVNGQSLSRVMNESKKHGDIIVADFIDTYRNLTYKTMSGFRWALESCFEFRYFLSLDDDVMLSIPNLLKYLRDPYNYPNVRLIDSPSLGTILPHTQRLFSGQVYKGNPVIRDKDSRYYVSPEAYPFATFPPQISGFMVILSWETVSSFHHLASYIAHISVDDAFLGILANELRVQPLHTREYADYEYSQPDALLKNSTLAKDFIALCCFFPQEKFKLIWDRLYRL